MGSRDRPHKEVKKKAQAKDTKPKLAAAPRAADQRRGHQAQAQAPSRGQPGRGSGSPDEPLTAGADGRDGVPPRSAAQQPDRSETDHGDHGTRDRVPQRRAQRRATAHGTSGHRGARQGGGRGHPRDREAVRARLDHEARVPERQAVDVIPTGSIALDLALGVGGIPRGRITEIFGPESSGKTTLCQHVLAEAQRSGGVVAFIDVEHALDPGYARACGVNVDELLVSQPDTGEQALEITETLIRSGGIDCVVVDSVAALVPRAEIEGEMGDSFMGIQARLMSQALRKLTGAVSRSNTALVFTNQLREKIGVMFGNPETTPGGRALKFYASVRLDIRRVETIKTGTESVGNRVRVKVVKNKVAPPFRVAEFDVMYGEGISKEGGLLDVGVAMDVVTKTGAWFTFGETRLGQGREAVQGVPEGQPGHRGRHRAPDPRQDARGCRSPSRASKKPNDRAARRGAPAAAPALGSPSRRRADGARGSETRARGAWPAARRTPGRASVGGTPRKRIRPWSRGGDAAARGARADRRRVCGAAASVRLPGRARRRGRGTPPGTGTARRRRVRPRLARIPRSRPAARGAGAAPGASPARGPGGSGRDRACRATRERPCGRDGGRTSRPADEVAAVRLLERRGAALARVAIRAPPAARLRLLRAKRLRPGRRVRVAHGRGGCVDDRDGPHGRPATPTDEPGPKR